MPRQTSSSKFVKSSEKGTPANIFLLRIVIAPVAVAILAVLLVHLATYFTSENIPWWNGSGAISPVSVRNASLGWISHAPYVNHFVLSGTFNWSAAPVYRPPLAEVPTVDLEQVSGVGIFWEAYIKGRPAVVTGFQNLEKLAAVATGRKQNEAILNALRKAHGLMECPLTIGKIMHKNATHNRNEPHGKVKTRHV